MKRASHIKTFSKAHVDLVHAISIQSSWKNTFSDSVTAPTNPKGSFFIVNI